MKPPAKLLLVFVNEADMWHNRPLYQAIVERLHQLDIAGATAQIGVMDAEVIANTPERAH